MVPFLDHVAKPPTPHPLGQLASFFWLLCFALLCGGGGGGGERGCCLRSTVTGLAFETYSVPDLVTFAAAECCITNCQAQAVALRCHQFPLFNGVFENSNAFWVCVF